MHRSTLAARVVLLLSLAPLGAWGRPAPAQEPGFYGAVDGWGGRGQSDRDINGEIGHPVFVGGPRALCINVRGGGAGNWTSYTRVTSGVLPPGLAMQNSGDITGIPTARGHWIVTVSMSGLVCNGLTYSNFDFQQQLRFHITGTGEVIQ
jgi:hypothetical protein